MWPDVIVLFEPLINDGLGLSCCCEPFGVKDFATQRSVKALIVSVRPKIAPLERFLYGLTPFPTCYRPEMTAQSFVDWAVRQNITLRFIQPGKPNQNAFIERFNKSYRQELLDANLFDTLAEV